MSSGFARSDWRYLGQTDLTISPIGLGTVKFGRNTGVKYPSSFDLPDDSQLDTLVQTAKDLGINFLDTAPAYGESEKKIGELIKGDRSDWIISTKVGEQYENGVSRFDFSAAATRRSVEHSLRCLKTDYLDIVLIHLDDGDEATLRHGDVIGELVLLKEKGFIRSIGASTKTVTGGLLALDLTDLVMVTYNPQDISQSTVVERAHELGKGVIVKKALASGHTSNVRDNLEFVLGNRSVCSAIVGTINPQHLIQNVQDALTILS
jgi:aryl-alcohol dehydrogenase-like predicted oxidoreductase